MADKPISFDEWKKGRPRSMNVSWGEEIQRQSDEDMMKDMLFNMASEGYDMQLPEQPGPQIVDRSSEQDYGPLRRLFNGDIDWTQFSRPFLGPPLSPEESAARRWDIKAPPAVISEGVRPKGGRSRRYDPTLKNQGYPYNPANRKRPYRAPKDINYIKFLRAKHASG